MQNDHYGKNFDELVVLYAEDEPGIRELVKDMLSRRIKNFHVAENGKMAWEMFQQINPDLVITDINMPYMDGLELSAKIKEVTPSVKIIITSAYSDSTHFIEAIKIGIDEYVLKPVEYENLLKGISRVADGIYMQRQINRQYETISKLYSAIEQSKGFVVIYDKNRIIEYVNPRFSEIMGYTKEEVTGDHSTVSFNDLCDLKHNPAFEKVLGENQAWRGEYSIKHKTGEIIYLFGSLSPVYDKQGHLVSYVQVGEDISELKEMAANLADKEDKLRNLIEKLGEGIAIIDLTYDFMYCNPALKEIFECDDLVDQNLSSFVRHPGQMKEINRSSRDLKVGEKLQLEMEIQTLNKNHRSLSVTLTPQLQKNGSSITGLFCIFKDMTRSKELIEELKAAHDTAQKAYETIEEKNDELNLTNKKLKQSEKKLSELNEILMEYIKATGK